jgi:hypothetical protein
MKNINKRTALLMTVVVFLFVSAHSQAFPPLQNGGGNPPSRVVKLIFIHHSTGENWLSDGYGNLGRTLGQNNYFVSDTNYGWGPDGIGDRTDIPDWLEWFRGDNTESYWDALLHESGQNSSYTRGLSDPGGENEIIMFKSCFPNSDLEGNPNDPPTADGWLSVGHAKYVYNQLLFFFQEHPDKLFIIVTAPPLSDRSHADNARAFNLWLVEDWLAENNYPYHNVAVFDFYNVLTGPDGHHTYEGGSLIHQVATKNTLHYPSGDDHPSEKGSQKATEDFIPLLNYYYNRWQMDAPTAPPAAASSEETESGGDRGGSPPEISGIIDDFQGGIPNGTSGWEGFWDESTPTSISCTLDTGGGQSGGGLQIDYLITPYSWGTCALSYDQAQNWSGSDGITFSVRTDQEYTLLDVDLYVDGPEGLESYISQIKLGSGDWNQVAIPWDNFHRVDWEAEAGSPFKKAHQVSRLAFGFSNEGESDIEGMIWIDDLSWMTSGDVVEEEAPRPGRIESSGEEGEDQRGRRLPCIGSLFMPLGLIGVVLLKRKKTIR